MKNFLLFNNNGEIEKKNYKVQNFFRIFWRIYSRYKFKFYQLCKIQKLHYFT